MARAWRVLELDFRGYPNPWWPVVIAVASYVNFFTHHFLFDIRWFLFAGLALVFWRTVVHYRLNRRHRQMPLLVGFGLIATVIWGAENAATFFNVCLYPDQESGWRLVSINKLGSWYLLMVLSFVVVEALQGWYRRSGMAHETPISRQPPPRA